MFAEFKIQQLKRIRQYHRRVGTRLLTETIPLSAQMAVHTERVPFEDLECLTFAPVDLGTTWGKGSDRAWFRIEGRLPANWSREEAVLWLDTNTEVLVRDHNGGIQHGLVSGGAFDDTSWKMARPLMHLDKRIHADGTFLLWAEAACMTHPGSETLNQPAEGDFEKAGFPFGVLNRCCLGRFNAVAWALYCDMDVLIDLLDAIPEDTSRHARVFRALKESCDILGRNPDDSAAARERLRPELEKPAHASSLTTIAVGHGHLDTAWLWPLNTAKEKILRTYSNQLDLIDRYPNYVFGASAALHYKWLRETEPALFQRVSEAVHHGRWEVQGAMWVEPDTNLPSGESLIRQILYGTRFFKEHFGEAPDTLWLPDVFGYSAALPGIMRSCGVRCLLTQKISWSQFHKFPHKTFRWEGIDASEVVVHFPPEDNYCSGLTPTALADAEARFAEKDRLEHLLSLFGYGDGGGGPHPIHLERAQRQADLEGVSKVRLASSREFFDTLLSRSQCLDTWKGELYLELHRKTLTTQAWIKAANRQLETRLWALEILCTAKGVHAPKDALRAVWETLLLNQFHDIIPGSSIQEVYREAREQFSEANQTCAQIEKDWAKAHLESDPHSFVLFNPLPHSFKGQVVIPKRLQGTSLLAADGTRLPTQSSGSLFFATVDIPAFGFSTLRKESDAPPGNTSANTKETLLENDRVRYEFDANGQLISARLKAQPKHEWIHSQGAGNRLCLYNDDPTQWEAWDIDIHYLDEFVESARCLKMTRHCGPVFQELEMELAIGTSTIHQRVRLAHHSARLDFVTEIDWCEDRKLLRVGFQTTVRSERAAYDIQFGHVYRPTQANTSREAAMFEVCGHRFADLSDSEGGVALLNDSKYGYRVIDGELSLSLLCAPRFPDPTADRGHHQFTYAFLPHTEAFPCLEVLNEASCLNRAPLLFDQRTIGNQTPQLPFSIDQEGVEIAACKSSEDGSGQIVRIVERLNRHTEVCLRFPGIWKSIEVDALENPLPDIMPQITSVLKFTVAPFQIRSFRLEPTAESG